jgi:hypothetical protein
MLGLYKRGCCSPETLDETTSSTRNVDTMVRGALTTVALLAACGAAGAVPTAATAAPTFSFVEWVDEIIANPNGDHLTPEQAVAAFYASRPWGTSSRIQPARQHN